MDEMDKGLSGEELLASIENNPRMTPQEKLHATLFYHEKVLVKDMDTLTLRAHIEELSKIAFEARSRHGAATDEEQTRKKTTGGKPKGFERSLNIDETTSDAINAIKDRQKKLTKAEKVQEGLKKLYELSGATNSDKEAARVMSAQTIILQVKEKIAEKKTETSEVKQIFNPFTKKES